MKIGIFDPYLDDLGGGEKYILSLASCLSQNNDVSLFWDKKEDLKEVTQRFSIDISRVELTKNIFSKDFGFFQKLKESSKYEVILFLSDGSIPILFCKKLFLHLQQPIKRPRYSIKDHLKIKRVNKVICNSKYTQGYLDNSLKNKSIVIYPPINLKPKKVNKENIILTVGRFRVKNVGTADYKKQSVLLDAFLKMVDQGLKNWKFVLATSVREHEREEFEKLKKKAKDYPVEFLVNKTNDELWDIYSKSKIYWHATGFGEDLEKHPDYAEHFGISTVEAMGGGCVPIVIDAGGQREIVDDGMNGFIWNDIQTLKKLTLKLINDPGLLEKFENKSREKANEFAKRDFCKEIQNLITNG